MDEDAPDEHWGDVEWIEWDEVECPPERETCDNCGIAREHFLDDRPAVEHGCACSGTYCGWACRDIAMNRAATS